MRDNNDPWNKLKPAPRRSSLQVNIPRPTVLPGMTARAGVLVTHSDSQAKPKQREVRHARTLNGQPIGLIPDFITEKERATLHKFVSRDNAPWETSLPEDDVWHGRIINPRSMSPLVLKLARSIRKRTVAHICAEYGITDEVYADTLQLVRWRPGDSQRAHADCEEPDGRPNKTPWRAFASILYLNDEFEGGGLHFPKRGLRPQIKPRMLAYFPSTRQYLHGVDSITAGVRYTMSCFYTFDPSRHDGYAL